MGYFDLPTTCIRGFRGRCRSYGSDLALPLLIPANKVVATA